MGYYIYWLVYVEPSQHFRDEGNMGVVFFMYGCVLFVNILLSVFESIFIMNNGLQFYIVCVSCNFPCSASVNWVLSFVYLGQVSVNLVQLLKEPVLRFTNYFVSFLLISALIFILSFQRLAFFWIVLFLNFLSRIIKSFTCSLSVVFFFFLLKCRTASDGSQWFCYCIFIQFLENFCLW